VAGTRRATNKYKNEGDDVKNSEKLLAFFKPEATVPTKKLEFRQNGYGMSVFADGTLVRRIRMMGYMENVFEMVHGNVHYLVKAHLNSDEL
jgi:hypothetical protein